MKFLFNMGLQKRIFLYVSIGLAILLGVFSYLGLRAIRYSTDLVFQERLGLAHQLAAGLGLGFEHIADDVKDDMDGITPISSRSDQETAVRRTFHHLTRVDKFPLFKVTGVHLITEDNRVIAEPQRPLPMSMDSIALHIKGESRVKVFSLSESEASSFVFIMIPLTYSDEGIWGLVLVDTIAISSPQFFTPMDFLNLAAERKEPPRQSWYNLEIIGPEGLSLFTTGSSQTAGKISSHSHFIEALREGRESYVTLHQMPDNLKSQDHVVAMVPVPGSDLYLALEQEKDIAMALPSELLHQFLLFGGAGFLVALLTAWITTRSVVRPTRELTRASERMAKGELSAPVSVHAQDEIGRLAENLEYMRRRLNSALQELEQSNRELETRVKDRTYRLSQALERIIGAQEEERRRLARELHDETAQAIVTLGIMLDNIREKALVEPSAAREQALKARELVSNLLEETRRLIFDLRPMVLDDLGLVPALRWYAERHLENKGIKVSFMADTPSIHPSMQVAMFRIAQEAINNIARHSRASHARIEVFAQNGAITMVVEDNGQGFSMNGEHGHASKVGLVGMRERAKLLGAKLEISSTPGQGTSVRLEVPEEPHHG